MKLIKRINFIIGFATFSIIYSSLPFVWADKCKFIDNSKTCNFIEIATTPSKFFYDGIFDLYKLFLNGFSFKSANSGLISPDSLDSKKRFEDLKPGFNFEYQPYEYEDLGYLVLAKSDAQKDSEPLVEIWDLNSQEIIHKYKINKNELKVIDMSKDDFNKLRINHPLVLSDGSFIGVSSREGHIFKFDKCGALSKTTMGGYHHSIQKDSKNRIYVPIENVPNEKKPVGFSAYRNEGFAILDTDLNVLSTYSLTKIFEQAGIESEIYSEDEISVDPFHINDVTPLILDNGSTILFLSIRNQALLIGYDLDNEKPLWVIKGATSLQHHITPLNKEGTAVSVFDNNTSNFNQFVPNHLSHEGNKMLSIFNLPNKLVDKSDKPKMYLGKNLVSQGLEINIDDFKYLPSRLRPYTRTGGLGEYYFNNKFLFIEETNHGRLLEIDLDNNKILWQYINKNKKTSIPYSMSWSRRLEKLPFDDSKIFESCNL